MPIIRKNKKNMFDKYDFGRDFGKKYEIDYGKLMNGLRDIDDDDNNRHLTDYLDYFNLIQNNYSDKSKEPVDTPEQIKMKNRNLKIDDLLK